MAANKAQGQWFSVFLIALTVVCFGVATFAGGLGKLALIVGIIGLALCMWKFLQIKPLEGKVSLEVQPAITKLIGVAMALLGWVIVLFGIHLSVSVGGRLVTTVIGLVVSFIGVLYILPVACNKNAIWKS